MTNENIVAGNKLIAEFMGGIYHSKLFPIGETEIWLPFHNICTKDRLKYHSDWNWLMPVISKCESIDSNRIREEIGIRNIFEANFQICWLACLAFIEWYNAQKTV